MSLLSDMRQSYERGELEEQAAASAPLAQFKLWFEEALAAKVAEPNAMTLATVGPEGQPSTRIVLVKDVDERGLVWYTNYQSRKGQELAQNTRAALQFHWVTMERVVRIEGTVSLVSPEESDAYFQSRPLDSRLGAASTSSKPITRPLSTHCWLPNKPFPAPSNIAPSIGPQSVPRPPTRTQMIISADTPNENISGVTISAQLA